MSESARNQHDAPRVSLTEALAAIDVHPSPVDPAELKTADAVGCTLAADTGSDNVRCLAGSRLRRIDVALLTALKVEHVTVRRPCVFITRAAKSGPTADATCALIAGAIESEGGIAVVTTKPLLDALNHRDSRAVIVIGRDDESSRTLASMGGIFCDGLALTPGGDTVFGLVGMTPVLLLSGHIEDALAGWLTLGRRLLARLAFRLIEEQPFLLELARPIASTRGMAEVVPVRRRAAQVEPLTNDPWSAQSIARADGWILVPADSDGLSAGARVQMRPWP
jgi:molybdopterin molybdotransferase